MEQCGETSVATDVMWPMLILESGGSLGYYAGDGIRVLARDDFGSATDERDDDPAEWLGRSTMAELHVRSMVELSERSSSDAMTTTRHA